MAKFRFLHLSGLVFAAIIASSADAQIAKRGNGYQFRMKFVKTSKIKFLIASNVQLPAMGQTSGKSAAPAKMLVTLSADQIVKDVKGQVATIDYTLSPPMMNGQPLGNQGPTTTSLKMDNQGNVVGKGQAPQGVNAKYPQKPLRIGESWKATMPLDVPFGGGKTQMTSTYKFVGIRNMSGKQVAELDVTSTSNDGKGPSGGGKMFLLMSDGMLFSAKMKMKMAMPGGQGSAAKSPPMLVEVDMRRG